MKIEARLKLNDGEKISLIKKHRSRCSRQRCRYFYDILNKNGEKLGSAVYKEESDYDELGATKFTVKRYDLNERLVYRSEWGRSVWQNHLLNKKKIERLKHLKRVLRSDNEPVETSLCFQSNEKNIDLL